MEIVAQGEDITLTAIFYDALGQPADATNPLVDVLDEVTVMVNNATPTHEGTGQYSYTYTVPEDGTISALWKFRWTGTVGGEDLGPIEELFEVVAGDDVPWVTLAAAKELTNDDTISSTSLNFAAQEIYDEMRWTPEFDVDLTEENYAGVAIRADALGRAIAWQASYRQSTTATPSDGSATLITSESFDAYSVGYGGQTGRSGIRSGGMIAERALKLLRQYGLYNMTGISSDQPRYRYLVANAADVLSDP